MDIRIDPDLIARFRAAIARANLSDQRFGLAVSGGTDSLAMLLLAQCAYPDQFEVATVDHGLRDSAKDECAFVADVCEERGIHCDVLQADVLPGNLQAQARAARYLALEDWTSDRGLSAILTAHQADDQAETLMMRLNRGSGLSGLAGVRFDYRTERSAVRVVRPLLKFRRVELDQVIAASGLDAVKDPSNVDPRFDRVRMRQALRDAEWLDPQSVAKSAELLADADEALEFAVDRFWDEHVERTGDFIRLRLDPMRTTRLRLMKRAIQELGGNPRGGDVARLDENLKRQSKGNVAGVMIELRTEEEGQFLTFSPEPQRNS